MDIVILSLVVSILTLTGLIIYLYFFYKKTDNTSKTNTSKTEYILKKYLSNEETTTETFDNEEKIPSSRKHMDKINLQNVDRKFIDNIWSDILKITPENLKGKLNKCSFDIDPLELIVSLICLIKEYKTIEKYDKDTYTAITISYFILKYILTEPIQRRRILKEIFFNYDEKNKKVTNIHPELMNNVLDKNKYLDSNNKYSMPLDKFIDMEVLDYIVQDIPKEYECTYCSVEGK